MIPIKTESVNKTTEFWNLKPKYILTNDVIFPWEYNPHNVRPWILGNEYGAVCLVWAASLQDAVDAACDNNCMNSFLSDETDEKEIELYDLTRIGNAGELADLQHLWCREIKLEDQERKLIAQFAECRGAGYESLDYLT